MTRRKTPQSGAPSFADSDTPAFAAESGFRQSDGGPASAPDATIRDPGVTRSREVCQTVDGMPYNREKQAEYGPGAALPQTGDTSKSPSPMARASTLGERHATPKTGGAAKPGVNNVTGELSRVRADAEGTPLTTNQGVPVADNQNSLVGGLRGPALLKDFVLREKITHFDHERIPERVVHARGSAAHGYFESYDALTELTCAAPFAEAGKRTPVFVRFSTVAGERGSKDTARDVRGFAVKFYTDQGNWDLVGNNMPVFFIQDAMKFPDLVHAVKPEPNHAMPQAASAHDTFYDFISLSPESTHMMMWLMSDRAIPRSFRTMQGFGVHTYRFVNAGGVSKLVKFHWTPRSGTHSLVWDEAVKISGADPDFHRRDLWESIENGHFPEWELGVQIFTEAQADTFSFDVLDATKIVPEELIPITPIGRMVLDRNPDNFFAETEQVAFCVANVVPGVDFTNDPLLAGRIHSYFDTQISRLGGPNFHELPINGPIVPVQNHQRDGMHRQTIHRGRVAYDPNSMGGGCPFQAGSTGYVPFPEPVPEGGVEMRGKPAKFAEHFQQATLFYESQSPAGQRHIVQAYRFELSHVTVPGIRRRMLSMLRNVSEPMAAAIAKGLGMPLPDPMPPAADAPAAPEVDRSPALAMEARPGEVGIAGRKIAILVTEGADVDVVRAVAQALGAQHADVRLVGEHIGICPASDGSAIDADAALDSQPGFLFDAVVIPSGDPAVDRLCCNGYALEFVRNQFRHCKTLLALGQGRQLLDAAGITPDEEDPGICFGTTPDAQTLDDFVDAVSKHRHFIREESAGWRAI
ncbi:catalase HPII [Pandoraea vervacti]|uniref:Catalase n=1 Tax=Pandoraea vervacti TaxID=656178 RepID=A0ABN4U6J1_9BURK|nr:catalase [Pandoraea vervacti]APD11271.1 catalase HPII [Pandoraea vervacti]